MPRVTSIKQQTNKYDKNINDDHVKNKSLKGTVPSSLLESNMDEHNDDNESSGPLLMTDDDNHDQQKKQATKIQSRKRENTNRFFETSS